MSLKTLLDASNEAEARVQKIAAQINTLFDEGKTDEALKLRPDLDKAKNDAKEANQLYVAMREVGGGDATDAAKKFVPVGGDKEPKAVAEMRGSNEYRDQFWGAFKAGISPKNARSGTVNIDPFRMLFNALTETGGSPAGSQGGFLVPIDFDNMIREYQRLAVDLEQYVTVENVNTLSGWRVYETASASAEFDEIDEIAESPATETVGAMESPTFTKLDYTLKKYGGYLPFSNDLLADATPNIMAYIAKWCGRKTSLTNTGRTLALVNALTPTAVTDPKKVFSAVKTIFNTGLDPIISASARVFVNQSGFGLLDDLVDGTGRPLLQPDPASATGKLLNGRPIVVIPSAQWANTDTNTKTRIAIGDLVDFCVMFKRSAGEMATTLVGGGAWRNDGGEVRYIFRKLAKRADAAAVKLLSVTLP